MHARRMLTALLVATAALGCRPDIELDVPCAHEGDLSCPTGFQCDVAAGRCMAGEAPPRVTFPEIEEAAALKGRVEVGLSLRAVNGIDGVRLVAVGADQVSATLSPALRSGDGVQQGEWAATFDTWQLDDGPVTLEATVSDALGLTTTRKLGVHVANGVPAVDLSRPQAHTTVGDRFELEASISSFVPVQSVTTRIQGRQYPLTDLVKWKTTDRLSGELSATIGGDLTSGDAVLELVVTDVAGVERRVAIEVAIDAGS